MKSKFVSIAELLTVFDINGLKINYANISNCVREQLIKPVIYIETAPVHALAQDQAAPYAVGFCFLSAYWSARNEIIGIFDLLSQNETVTISKTIHKSDLLGEPLLFSWKNNPKYFEGIPPAHINTHASPEGLDIKYFRFVEPLIHQRNLLIARNEIPIILDYLNDLNITVSEPLKAKSPELSETERTGLLNTVGAIAKIYLEDKKNNQSGLISKIVERYKNPGLGQSTLERRLSKAFASLEYTSLKL